MMRPSMVVTLVASMAVASLAGCMGPGVNTGADPGDGAGAGSAAATEILLACKGADADAVAMESSLLGSCWGHVGHHIYVLPEPMVLHNVSGRVFAVEVTYTTPAGEPILPVQVSLDGQAWTQVATIDYPTGEDPSDRYAINLTKTEVEPVLFRFLRVHMPPSVHDGLAGYLDNSRFRANVTAPVAEVPPEAGARASYDCSDGILEAFFTDHPCWFGGKDRLDGVDGGGPQAAHLSTAETDESWFDAPSFIHTHYLGGGAGGPFDALVEMQLWRFGHFLTCSAVDPGHAPVAPGLIAQASRDGRTWEEVVAGDGSYTDPVAVQGMLPDGTRFLRFFADRSANYDAGGCHHPSAFLVDSRFTLDRV